MTHRDGNGGLTRLARRIRERLKVLEARYFPARVFTRIYEKGRWLSGGTPSGAGSTLERTAAFRPALVALLRRYGIRSMLDIPCGDFNWMQTLDYRFERYIGGDIVGSLVDANRARYGRADRTFERLDVIEDKLPPVDLILCRDCWVHLSNAQVMRAIRNVRRSGAIYLLATTYPEHDANPDIRTGNWRPVNLERAPFSLPPPLERLVEGDAAPWADKSLGLWRIADLAP